MSPTTPRGCTNFKLRQLLRSVSRLYDAELANAGLKGTQYSLLSYLAAAGPLPPGELARHMAMDPSTLTRNVKILLDHDWAEQSPGHDSRTRQLSLTPSGRAILTTAKAHWKRAQLDLNARLGTAQVAALHTMLDDAMTKLKSTHED